MDKKYGFRKRLTSSGEKIIWAKESVSAPFVDFLHGVNVVSNDFNGKIFAHAKKDISAFLKSVFGIKTVDAPITVTVIKDENLGELSSYKGRIITVDNNGVTVRAFDERGAAQAIYDLEDLMKDACRPEISFGEYKNKPLFSPRMAHSAYNLDVFPDGYLQNLAREGIDAILVFVKGINRNPVGEMDFNELIDRAEGFGIDVYAYCELPNFNSPEDENAKEVYAGIYGEFFKAHPKFKGMVFVGESVEFPSKDPRVACRHYYERPADNIPDGKVSPGWFPCKDYAIWLNLVKNSIRTVKPDADVVFWSYNWGWQKKEDRIALLNTIPTDISLLVTFEMFQNYEVEGLTERVCDYSLAFAGPGDYFLSEAETAKKRGIRLYAMTNTGGRTWDFGVLPYEPMIEQWQRRFTAVRECNKKFDLSGLMECHHFGYTPSFITDLAKKNFNYYAEDGATLLQREYKRLCGEDYLKAEKAFLLWSDAIRLYPANDEEQYCAMRVATAYPFPFLANIKAPDMRDEPTRRLPAGITEPYGLIFVSHTLGNYTLHSIRIRPEIDILKKMIALIKEGVAILKTVKVQSNELKRIINIGEFIICNLYTDINTKKAYIIKCELLISPTVKKTAALLEKLKKILKDEIANAEKSIKYLRRDSAIGYEASMGYACDENAVRWKIKQVNYVLDTEIKRYENGLRFSEPKAK